MIFQTETDKDGVLSVKKGLYNERDGHSYDVLKADVFTPPSDQSISQLNLVNHYIKSGLIKKMEDFEDVIPPGTDADFESINFKELFSSLFDNGVESFKKTFYIKDNHLINLYFGCIFFHDERTHKISWKPIPEYNFLWDDKIKDYMKFDRKGRRKNNNKEFDITEHIQMLPSLYSGFDFQYQYLNYIHSLLDNAGFIVDSDELKKKALDFLIKKGEIEHISNLDEFLRELTLISENYMSHRSLLNKKEEYVLNNSPFDVFSRGNLFTLMDGKMADLFYYTYNRRSGKRFSFLSGINEKSPLLSEHERRTELDKNSSLSMHRIESMEKALKAHNKINNLFLYKTYDFQASSDYILDRERGYSPEEPNQQIDKISYSEFINHYDLEDYTVNRCLFEYMGEYIRFNKKIRKYIDSVMQDFASINEKLKIITRSESEKSKHSFRDINLRKINNKLDLPLAFIKNLYGENVDPDKKELCRLIVRYIDKSAIEKYDVANESFSVLLDKFFRDYIEIPKENAEIFNSKERNVFFKKTSSLIEFLKIIEVYLEEKGEGIKGSIDTKKETEDMLVYSSPFPRRGDEDEEKEKKKTSFEDLKKFVSKHIVFCLTGDVDSSEDDLKRNTDALLDVFAINLNEAFVINASKNTPVFDESNSAVCHFLGSGKYNVSLLNYHLLKGHNDVVKHLINKGAKAHFEETRPLSSLEYALVGRCDNDIIDWVCEGLAINKQYFSKMFGFIVFVTGGTYDMNLSRRLMLKTKSTNCFFTQQKEKQEKSVLEKMVYVYEKYGVNFNFALHRLIYLLKNKDCAFILKNKLGLDKEIIHNIEYGIHIKNLLLRHDFSAFEREIKEGRLNFHTNLGLNINDDRNANPDDFGILTLLYAFVDSFGYEPEKKAEEVLEKTVSILLDNIPCSQSGDLRKITTMGEMNIIEILMEKNVRKYQDLIKRLVLEYGFSLDSSKLVFPLFISASTLEVVKENKSYRELYFNSGDYELTLFDKLKSDIEKEKLMNIVDNSSVKENSKRRM